ncbi:MAG: mechanosensitive ion channel [Oscillospiraceae bacterium]|jgi:small conductance mechanosensitive channel|nr:mechanosensitive ion channel [Oscillospiraceae bacterium]
MNHFVENAIDLGSTYGGKIIAAVLILVIGHFVIKLFNKAFEKGIDRLRMDETVRHVAKNAVRVLLHAVLIISVIEVLGVSMSSVVAILASCGLAVGLALQGALGNLAGGMMILIFKPFKIGDYIESGGAEGTVRDISIFYTSLTTLDNKRIFVPNGDLMNANVTNYTHDEKRRVDLDFKITNDIDAEFVKRVLLSASEATKGVLSDPPSFARMTAVDDDTYIFTVRSWCRTEDYWDVYFDLIENCSKALRDNDIDDPEERIAVRLVGEDDKAPAEAGK